MELKRLLMSKNLIICAMVLVIACCGFYIKEQGDNTYFDASKYYNFKSETMNLYKNCSIEQARESINSRIERLDVFSQLGFYTDFKSDDIEYYLEYMADEEKEYRAEHSYEAAMYDANPNEYDSMKYSMIYTALHEVKAQIDYVDTYDEFLENIKVQAENMSSVSIFSKANSFSSRNIEKTLVDYEGLEGTELALGIDEPVTTVMNYELVHYFMLIFIILLVTQLLSERKQGLWSIVHAAPMGRARLAVRRLGIIAVSISAIGILLYSSLFVVSSINLSGPSFIYL